VTVAGEAGKRLEELVPDIRRTAELIQEISAASGEQSSGADQIAKGVTQMDMVVQQNAGSSEELAATAEELAAQSTKLVETIGYFKVSEAQAKALRGAAESAEPAEPATAHRAGGLRAKRTSAAAKPEPKSAAKSTAIVPVKRGGGGEAGAAGEGAGGVKDSDFEEF
jgi:methyl-accepting chemotaxis protein